jgi:hypothetical protein
VEAVLKIAVENEGTETDQAEPVGEIFAVANKEMGNYQEVKWLEKLS